MTDQKDTSRYIKIEGQQVEIGMYVHALHCSWLKNPFWRKSFLLTNADDQAQIREYVPHVTIDLARGRGLTQVPAPIAAAGPVPDDRDAVPPPAVAIRAKRRKPPSEIDLARETAARATATVARLFGEARLGQVIHTSDLMPMVEDMARATANGIATMVAVTRLKDQDQYTYIHSVAVGTLMMGLARHLGLDDADVRVAGMAGLLHDMGKTQVPVAILDKPGPLTLDELDEMRRHPGLGHDILCDIADLDPRILDVCRHHHERMDGAGYADGLKGAKLSGCARMAAVCDVYDAVTSIRTYKRAWSPHEALARMAEWQGHFDATMLDALIASLGIQPYGALVRLHSNRLGLVVREGDSPHAPIVRVFFHVPDQQRIAIEDVATVDDPILRSERGPYWFGERWPMLHAEIMAGAQTARHALPTPGPRRARG